MKSNITKKPNYKDIIVGFFGWLLISNLLLILYFFLLDDVVDVDYEYETLGWIFWLITITVIIYFYAKKRVWLSAGILTEFIINIGIWMIVILPQVSRDGGLPLSDLLFYTGYPLPLGIFMLALLVMQ